jgi:cephalosporin hydroxylase
VDFLRSNVLVVYFRTCCLLIAGNACGTCVDHVKSVLKIIEARVREGFRSAIAPRAIRSLRRLSSHCQTIEEYLALVNRFRFLGIRIAPLQVPSEIIRLLSLLARNPPKTVLEIGTAKGGSLFLFSRVAAENARLVSLDLPHWPLGEGYAPWRERLYRSFARARQRVELLRADSHAPRTLERVKSLLEGRAVDFLFIDGDHRYEGVKADFELYSPLVRDGGLVGFHDIVPGLPQGVGDVPRFWTELKRTHTVEEFVADWKQQAAGIGLLHK